MMGAAGEGLTAGAALASVASIGERWTLVDAAFADGAEVGAEVGVSTEVAASASGGVQVSVGVGEKADSSADSSVDSSTVIRASVSSDKSLSDMSALFGALLVSPVSWRCTLAVG